MLKYIDAGSDGKDSIRINNYIKNQMDFLIALVDYEEDQHSNTVIKALNKSAI